MELYFYQTVLGRIGIGSEGEYISRLLFERDMLPSTHHIRETDLIRNAYRQLQSYLSGELKEFDLALKPRGTDFMKHVWQCLQDVPYGQTTSYLNIARCVGNGKAYRAVGMANNKNPIPIFIPCHRVVGSDGKLTGYRGGLDIKRKLLQLESENL